jgi:hypothetical protein
MAFITLCAAQRTEREVSPVEIRLASFRTFPLAIFAAAGGVAVIIVILVTPATSAPIMAERNFQIIEIVLPILLA